MKLIIAVLMLILPLLNAVACPELTIPQMVKSYIKANHIPYVAQDYEVVEESEITKCQLVEDFNGDGRSDYVAILQNTDDKYLYLVAFVSKEDSYSFQKLSKILGVPDKVLWYFLFTYPPGLKLLYPYPHKLTTKLPSPVLSPMEGCNTVYSWLDGKFVEVYLDEESEC